MQVNRIENLDNTNNFITTYLPIIVATISGLVGTGLGIYNFIQRQRERKPIFGEFKRGIDTVGIWRIYVHSPNKPIRKCYATFRDEKLPLWDGKGYERTIPLGGGVNFLMPEGVSKDDNDIILIKSGRQVIEKSRFNQMETIGDSTY
jgi:hypothetical protein